MEAHPRKPEDLFSGKIHFEIPPFQRPYVWNEEDQWAPLWSDVLMVAEEDLLSTAQSRENRIPQHFLGAVVYETKGFQTGDVTRPEIIDGQQRMTTLQVLIRAVHDVISKRGHDDLSEALDEITRNKGNRFKGKREQYKLWPSQADRDAFERVMSGEVDKKSDHALEAAYRFFRKEVDKWVRGVADLDGGTPPSEESDRVQSLCATIQSRLVVVAIDLSGHDDSQLIFETLNDRGTPLLKSDLIKNWIFRCGEQIGADVEKWASGSWGDFDGAWWREEITQGRQLRSRVDIFFQYWLTMRLREEVKAEHTFRLFKELAEPQMRDVAAAEIFLKALRHDADTYRSLSNLDDHSVAGRFRHRVIDTMEQAAMTPLLLWLLSESHGVPQGELKVGLEALESWVIRRSLLRYTTKDVNKFMVTILKALETAEPAEAGSRIRDFLLDQTADARIWPSDAEMRASLPNAKVYGNIRQSRLRMIFLAVDEYLRQQDGKPENVTVNDRLEIEHVMPQAWREHWNDPPLAVEAAAERDKRVNTIGNLTLITGALNNFLSNRPWTDARAQGLEEGGEPNLGKSSLLRKSLLVLNLEILEQHPDDWSDADIEVRSQRLVQAICAIWGGPSKRRLLDARD